MTEYEDALHDNTSYHRQLEDKLRDMDATLEQLRYEDMFDGKKRNTEEDGIEWNKKGIELRGGKKIRWKK